MRFWGAVSFEFVIFKYVFAELVLDVLLALHQYVFCYRVGEWVLALVELVVKFAILLLVLIEFFFKIFKFIIKQFSVVSRRSLFIICKSVEISCWFLLLVEVQGVQIVLSLTILFLFVVIEVIIKVPVFIAVVVLVTGFVF